jgi:RNA polymerase-associated protein CTR9
LAIQALKLAERAIQYADTLGILSDGYLRAGRINHEQGIYDEAAKHYGIAAEESPANILAAIGLAQIQIQTGQCL